MPVIRIPKMHAQCCGISHVPFLTCNCYYLYKAASALKYCTCTKMSFAHGFETAVIITPQWNCDPKMPEITRELRSPKCIRSAVKLAMHRFWFSITSQWNCDPKKPEIARELRSPKCIRSAVKLAKHRFVLKYYFAVKLRSCKNSPSNYDSKTAYGVLRN